MKTALALALTSSGFQITTPQNCTFDISIKNYCNTNKKSVGCKNENKMRISYTVPIS